MFSKKNIPMQQLAEILTRLLADEGLETQALDAYPQVQVCLTQLAQHRAQASQRLLAAEKLAKGQIAQL